VRARRLLAERRALLAMGELSRAISEDARCGPAYLLLARMRSGLGDFAEAELLLARAVRLSQVADEALRERSLMRRRQGKTREALDDLQAYVALAPQDPGRLETLATVYIELKAWTAALAIYRRMLSLYEGSLSSEQAARTQIKVRALSLLAAEADPVNAGARRDRSWERRAMARFSGR
jgi:tetratricopeptide (TPR) repeat protein